MTTTTRNTTLFVLIHAIALSSRDTSSIVNAFTAPIIPSHPRHDAFRIQIQRDDSTKLYLWKNFNRNDNGEDDDASDGGSGRNKKLEDDKDDNVNPTVEKLQEMIAQNEALSRFATSVVSFSQKMSRNLGKIKLVAASFFAGIVLTVSLTVYTVFTTIGEDTISPVQESAALMETILTDLTKGYVDEVDSRGLFETGVSAMLSSLDPYTEFENMQDAEAMQETITSKYGGIGLVIQEVNRGKKGQKESENFEEGNEIEASYQYSTSDDKSNTSDDETHQFQVRAAKAFEGYAFDHGIRTGDELVAVDDTPISSFSSIDQVRSKLRGEVGTIAKIDIMRDGVGQLTVEVPRQVVKIPDVKLTKLLPDDIGYVQLSSFTTDTGLEMRNAILNLQSEVLELDGNGELKGLILDLRGNPGGLLTSAVDVASLFVPQGSDIVSAKGRGFPGVLYRSRVEPLLNLQDGKTKLAVLVNSNTASAAEILSGAIQDLDLGVIVGTERTYGKGLVQNVQELPFSTALKYTVAKYYTPSGRCIQSIDYKEGKNKSKFEAVQIEDKDKNDFYTKSGRIVKDGGGIEVDYKVEAPQMSALEVTLLRSGVMKEFASEWSKSNQLTDNFSISETLYKDFQSFVNKQYQSGKINLTAIYSNPLKELRESLEESKYQVSRSEVNGLEKDIVREMLKDFDKYSKDIKEDLGNAILDRYLPDSMLLSRSLKTDNQVNAALKLLRSEREFNTLLARIPNDSQVSGGSFAMSKGGSSMTTSNANDSSVRVNMKW